MTKQEAAKLLSLIKLSYPQSYRDLDRVSAAATVNMWASSFAAVPYPIVERAFDRFRMRSKFPPTVAEMAGELKKIHFEAKNAAVIHSMLGNAAACEKLRALMACTENITQEITALPLGGLEDGKMGSAGASGNRLGIADGLSLLDAGAE